MRANFDTVLNFVLNLLSSFKLSIIRIVTHNKIGQQYIILPTQTLLMYSKFIVNHTVNSSLIMSKLETGTEISEQLKSKHQKLKTSE